ncbi:MAG TPA: AmmeMemoRadiSam system radical SAM enzyme [Candidatus Omnitrophota bacterium]|nr:AmmeMemoRadiSam system radical SAM enzyme [Candidatus Omnitrophota bacterium]
MKHLFRITIPVIFFTGLIVSCFTLPQLLADFPLHEASYYQKLQDAVVQCQLCPRLCVILPGKRGYCGVRQNQNGTLYTLSYARLVSITSEDPVEKKPLFHFLPGNKTFSIATAGCNLRCKFCQNWEISQACPDEINFVYLEPKELIAKAKSLDRTIIAYTYTEPVIFYEYMLDCAKTARHEGLRNVMHSNGYINEAPLRELVKYLDAANIDLKGFTNDFYATMSDATLAPVLRTLQIIKDSGVHLEITNLLIAGYNDDEGTIRTMCQWIYKNLGPEVPLHFSRAFPLYKLTGINPTPVEELERARDIARACGLQYVYIGNVAGNSFENTYCPRCKKLLIERKGYYISQNVVTHGKCPYCSYNIDGRWES